MIPKSFSLVVMSYAGCKNAIRLSSFFDWGPNLVLPYAKIHFWNPATNFADVIACLSEISVAEPKSCLVGDELARKNWNGRTTAFSPPKIRGINAFDWKEECKKRSKLFYWVELRPHRTHSLLTCTPTIQANAINVSEKICDTILLLLGTIKNEMK